MVDIVDVESEEIGEIEAVDNQSELVAEVEQKTEVPEKYRGKSESDLIRMHQEAEKLMSRQAQEVGEVRKLADELLRSQIQSKPEPEKQEVDFFENPQEAIRQAVASNPDLQEAAATSRLMKMERAKQSFNNKHPDAGEIIKDNDFIEWVKASPIRTQLFKAADAYDVNAADELLGTFKQLKAVKVNQMNEADKKARDSMMQAATVDTGGSGESGRKVYRRADLIRLKMSNPNKYAAMESEIYAAYQEGRVK